MQDFKQWLENRCWKGYKPVPGKKPYEQGSCAKKKLKESNLNENYFQVTKSKYFEAIPVGLIIDEPKFVERSAGENWYKMRSYRIEAAKDGKKYFIQNPKAVMFCDDEIEYQPISGDQIPGLRKYE